MLLLVSWQNWNNFIKDNLLLWSKRKVTYIWKSFFWYFALCWIKVLLTHETPIFMNLIFLTNIKEDCCPLQNFILSKRWKSCANLSLESIQLKSDVGNRVKKTRLSAITSVVYTGWLSKNTLALHLSNVVLIFKFITLKIFFSVWWNQVVCMSILEQLLGGQLILTRVH